MEAAHLVSSKPDAALRKMFHVSAAPNAELSTEWRRGLKQLTKQVRRAAAYRRRALEASASGSHRRALQLIRAAEDILKGAPVGVLVEFTGPLVGRMDLGAWIIRAARERARGERERIIARGERAGAG
jgi:hypothetical protein